MSAEEKPKVTIDLSPVLEAYCRAVFKTPKKDKEITLNRGKREGQAIYAKVFPVEFKPKESPGNNLVTFILPVTKNNQYVLRYHFYTIGKMGQEQIHDDLTVLMDKWLFRVFQRGYRKKYKQDEIITAILRRLNLRKNAVNYDQIKKYDYRQRCKIEENIMDELLTCSDPVY